ncbi:hypothetical protein [Gottfriedia acidiceleris]|uniref:hypothetical protein n=1 Tax=Gottfriedia acidiceleris TaxID=371036 RepID=UPI00101C7A04|nr:hypothetical protein [Gottfriedia acidiceleris]
MVVLLYLLSTNCVDYTNIHTILSEKSAFQLKGEEVQAVLNYYTGDYTYYRNQMDKTCFLQKPFIQTQSGKLVLVNVFYLAKIMSYGVYWIVRNFYMKKKSSLFINGFGHYFEKYFEEVLLTYVESNSITKIEEDNKIKRADWLIEADKYILIIEQKSALAKTSVKNITPNIDDLDRFLKRLDEGFEQLISTEAQFKERYPNKRIVKMLLHYEDLFVPELLEERIDSKFNRNMVFLIHISEMEKLISLLEDNEELFNLVIKQKIELEESKSIHGRSLGQILTQFECYSNDYLRKKKNKYLNISEEIKGRIKE